MRQFVYRLTALREGYRNWTDGASREPAFAVAWRKFRAVAESWEMDERTFDHNS
jgi:hypothetical protein